MLPIFGALSGGSLRLALAGVAAAVVFGGGFKGGLMWRDGQLERARNATAEAQREAGEEKANYGRLRADVGAAMQSAQDRAIELEAKHVESAKKAASGYERRIAAVLDVHRRLLNSTAGGGRDSAGGLPGSEPAACFDGRAAFERFAGRAAECARSEAKLTELQRLVRSHDEAVK
jgi:hypothetical protein